MATRVSGLHAANYRLDVTDFGPITKASVEMRPLTIFVDPSNTGKSYLAVLTYALHRCLAGDPSPWGRRLRPATRQSLPDLADMRGWFQSPSSQRTKALRRATVTLRAQTRRPVLIRWGTRLRQALDAVDLNMADPPASRTPRTRR